MRLNILLLLISIGAIISLTYALSLPLHPLTVGREGVVLETSSPIIRNESFPLAPNAVLHDLGDISYQLHDFKGKIIILNFWASWCVPCVVEFPQLLALADQNQDDLVFIAVSVDGSKDNINQFINRLDKKEQVLLEGKNVYMMWDPDKKITQDLFQTVRYPETYIIAPDLTLRDKIIGASIDFMSDEFKKRLDDKLR